MPDGLKEVKEAIKRAKVTSLKRKPLQPVFTKPRFLRPLELKKIEKPKIETEEDIKREIDNLISECRMQKDENLIKRSYKKALALCNNLKDLDNKFNYNQKLRELYDELTK